MAGRDELLRRIGVQPTIVERLDAALEAAVSEAERRSPGRVAVLDAGCGRRSPLVPFRRRIDRLVGVDIHAPDPLPRYLDAFATIDLSRPVDPLPDGPFDLVLSNFTVEHLAEPTTAFANLYAWLRPAGMLVLTTVNRRHPFVAAYLRLPEVVRARVQPHIKASKADAHPLVGACNDPAAITRALLGAGYVDVQVEMVGNLGRAWRRRWWTLLLGVLGDRLAQSVPSRRSTIIASARRPDGVPSE